MARDSLESFFNSRRSLASESGHEPREGTFAEMMAGCCLATFFGIWALCFMFLSPRLRTSRKFMVGMMCGLMIRIMLTVMEMQASPNTYTQKIQ